MITKMILDMKDEESVKMENLYGKNLKEEERKRRKEERMMMRVKEKRRKVERGDMMMMKRAAPRGMKMMAMEENN